MKLFKDNNLADALKKYKFTETGTPTSADFSDEFEIKMGRFIRRKQRGHNIRIISQRAAVAVLTIALFGSFFYLLILPHTAGNIVPLSDIEEHPLDIVHEDSQLPESEPGPEHISTPNDTLAEEDFCECCIGCEPVECVCYECGENEDCECSEPEMIDLSVIHSESDIEVSTVVELVSAISPNTVITLKAGLYDISNVVGFNSPYITWKSDTYGYKEKTLVISGIDNLTIQAEPGAEVEIVTPYRFAEILAFKRSNNISLIGIKAGHTVTGDYECDEGVISFEYCKNIFVDNCHFYGCGSVGISMKGSSDALVQNTIIDDCSRAALIIDQCTDIEFINCKFIDNRAYQFILGIWGSSVSFTDCEISGNNNLGNKVIEIDGFGAISTVLFDRCIIIDNISNRDYIYDDDLVYWIITGVHPSIEKRPYIGIRDSMIGLGNFCDYWIDGIVTDLGGNTLR